jgi:hypothetical protein
MYMSETIARSGAANRATGPRKAICMAPQNPGAPGAGGSASAGAAPQQAQGQQGQGSSGDKSQRPAEEAQADGRQPGKAASSGATRISDGKEGSRVGPDSGNARGNDIGPARKGESTDAKDAAGKEAGDDESHRTDGGARVASDRPGAQPSQAAGPSAAERPKDGSR